MPRDDDKIISLEKRREQEADRKRAQVIAAREAQRRRRLAERGPTAVWMGRLIGQVAGVVIVLAALASLGFWVWSLVRPAVGA
jgi:hypothetical protein